MVYLEKIRVILKRILGENYREAFGLTHDFDDATLHLILSDSVQALHFVTMLEEEFQIEFLDEDIDLDFFSNFDSVVRLIDVHSSKKRKSIS